MTKAEPATPNEYGFPAEDLVGRFVQTPFGQENCVMKALLWAYYDWLAEKGFKPEALLANACKKHPELPVSKAMSWQLHHLAFYRQENNLENPPWLVVAPLPRGFEDF